MFRSQATLATLWRGKWYMSEVSLSVGSPVNGAWRRRAGIGMWRRAALGVLILEK